MKVVRVLKVAVVVLLCVTARAVADSPVEAGKNFFTGRKAFAAGGPPCMACHMRSDTGFPGGRLGPSLDDAGENFSVEELMDFLGSGDSPTMAAAYRFRPLTEQEKKAVALYLTGSVKPQKRRGIFFVALAVAGLFFLITAAARKSFFA